LLLKEYRGVLSTHSKAMPGFPFGSVVPYCLDEQGRPLILISRIAQHTHNLQKTRSVRCWSASAAEDVQAVGRLTYLAEAQQLEDEALSKPPPSVTIAISPNRRTTTRPTISISGCSSLCAIVISAVSARFTGSTTDPGQPFAGRAEVSMVEHMNADHAKAIAHYVDLAGLPKTSPAQWPVSTARACTCASVRGFTGCRSKRLVILRHKFAKPWFSWLTPNNGRKMKWLTLEFTKRRRHLRITGKAFLR
jgi:hypothetical protein